MFVNFMNKILILDHASPVDISMSDSTIFLAHNTNRDFMSQKASTQHEKNLNITFNSWQLERTAGSQASKQAKGSINV